MCSIAVLGEFEDVGQNLLPIFILTFKGDSRKTTTTREVIAGIFLEGSEYNYASRGNIVVRGGGEFEEELPPQIRIDNILWDEFGRTLSSLDRSDVPH